MAGTETPVAGIVGRAYAESPDAAAAAAGVERQDVLEALTYCAERRCDAADARCRGCRLWTEARGLETLDAFLERFAETTFGESPLRVTGGGGGETLANPGTLDDLARTWAGEEFWFLARRVLRRIRHKQDRGGKLAISAGAVTPAFILVEPQMADNIGMVARAMANFAIDDLRLVAPRDGWPNDKARFAASGAHPIIDEAQVYETAEASIGDLHWVCATTARPRHLAKPVLTPEAAVAQMREHMAAGRRCGVLFGPERTGLSTDDVALADAVVMVRVNPTFASLNLAQAALLLGYEWLRQSGGGAIGRHTSYEGVEAEGLDTGSPPATKAQLLAFFEHLEGVLGQRGHFKPPEKRQTMIRNLRTMFERMAPSEQEVRTLRGIVATLERSGNTEQGR